jgi:hypothetical protein
LASGGGSTCIAAEDIGCTQTIVTASIQLRPKDPTIPFTLCSRQFATKLAFAMTVSKAQRQTPKRAAIYEPSPAFFQRSDALHLTASLLPILKVTDSV